MTIRTPFMDILDGGHEFYVLERRLTLEGPPGSSEKELKPYKCIQINTKVWHLVGDSIRNVVYGQLSHPEDETYSVWTATGYEGWWTLEFALKALIAARQADKKGKFNPTDGYGRETNTWRYEWRVTRIRLAKVTEEVDLEMALAQVIEAPKKIVKKKK